MSPPAPSARPVATPGENPPVTRFEPDLRIPGPISLPPSIREAGGCQMVSHRGEECEALHAPRTAEAVA